MREKVAQEFTIDDFPRLVRHHEQHRTEGPHRDGLKQMLKTERSTGGNGSRT